MQHCMPLLTYVSRSAVNQHLDTRLITQLARPGTHSIYMNSYFFQDPAVTFANLGYHVFLEKPLAVCHFTVQINMENEP